MLRTFEMQIFILLKNSTRQKAGEKEEKNEKDYARIFFCKNSRRLRDASTLKTVSKEKNNSNAIVSMLV
jgi:hypothetical protein